MPSSQKSEDLMQKLSKNLSFHLDETFIPNLVSCLGFVFVWKGMRDLIELYFLPEYPIAGNIVAIIIGITFLYLPDRSFSNLGGIEKKTEEILKKTEALYEQEQKIEEKIENFVKNEE